MSASILDIINVVKHNWLLRRREFFCGLLKVSALSLTSFIIMKYLIKHIDPSNKPKEKAATKAREIMKRLSLSPTQKLNDHEMSIASQLVDPNDFTVTWDSIGGLDHVIQEIKESVILPINRRDLFTDSNLTQPPKGVLLHGPPGCGKTMIAKATAKEAGCHFINLDVSSLTDKWYGESQKLATAVFTLAAKIQPCIIFIDEIDSFLRNRDVSDHEATAMMKAQFMTMWDGLCSDSMAIVVVMGATNRPLDLDNAIRRRMPASFHIPLPNAVQRTDILRLIMKGEPLDKGVQLDKIAEAADGFSGSDLRELCRNSTVYRIRDLMKHEDLTKRKPVDQSGGMISLSRTTKLQPVVQGGGMISQSRTTKLVPEVQGGDVYYTLRSIVQEDLKMSLAKMKDGKRGIVNN